VNGYRKRNPYHQNAIHVITLSPGLASWAHWNPTSWDCWLLGLLCLGLVLVGAAVPWASSGLICGILSWFLLGLPFSGPTLVGSLGGVGRKKWKEYGRCQQFFRYGFSQGFRSGTNLWWKESGKNSLPATPDKSWAISHKIPQSLCKSWASPTKSHNAKAWKKNVETSTKRIQIATILPQYSETRVNAQELNPRRQTSTVQDCQLPYHSSQSWKITTIKHFHSARQSL
jgi:hypothetical protein